MRKFIILSLLLISKIAMSQSNTFYKIIKDPKEAGSSILVGTITDSLIENSGFCDWYATGLKNYTLDSTSITALKKVINNYTFTVVIGNWCGDSQDLYPQFKKVMDAVQYKNTIELIGVDRKKEGLYAEKQILKIEKVPTFIIRSGPREIGRIVESFEEKSIEAALLNIISNDIKTFKK